MLPSTMSLAVSTKAFPRSGEVGCDRREQTNEGAPAVAANGCSPLSRHFVPPSTPRGEGFIRKTDSHAFCRKGIEILPALYYTGVV